MADWGTEQTARAEGYAAERAREMRAEQEGARLNAQLVSAQAEQIIREGRSRLAAEDYRLIANSGPGRARGYGSLSWALTS